MAKNSKNNPSARPDTKAPESGKKTRKKKKRKKHPVLFGLFTFFFCIFVAGMLTAIIVGGTVLSHADSIINGGKAIDLDTYKNSQSQTTIMYGYDDEGDTVELARLHGEENRIWVDYDEMPENLLWAFICLEDKRFYDHPGVDWIRTIGVFIKPEYEGQGASTITQQLIKNLTDDNEATYIRKFNEILRALNLERNYSKKDIVEAYLNTVSLGAGCYGVKTAAETYFGKELSELTLNECAMLAGITKAPYSLNPYANYDKCMERKNLCLFYMHQEGKITEKQKNKNQAKNVKVLEYKKPATENEKIDEEELLSWYEEYVIDQVIADLQEKYGYEQNEAWRQVYYGGLNIYAAVDIDIQNFLEKTYANRTGFPTPRSRDKNGNLPQSSMTIMDYEGRIVALVGSTGKKTDNRAYNRATDQRAKQQPGSSIKPLAVYAPAIDGGHITATSKILEKALPKYNNGKDWPRNFNGDHGSGKYVTVESALVRSLNTVPARILYEQLGTTAAMMYCNERFHINLDPVKDKDLSPLAVGGTTKGVTSLEMAAAFATFGNGGHYYKPYSYYKVTDRNGNILLESGNEVPQQSIKRETSDMMRSMLTKAVTESAGTGYGSKIHGFQTFAKTGTTSDNYDKWYCGGTPHYVTAVWYGHDYDTDLHTGSTNPAKTVFRYVFSEIHKYKQSKTFAETIEQADKNIAALENQ
ncbi:MAG: transglycosylase domain-containing protein [Acutalibacteraceae bacterium]|nr:transglycosylase domain-containing protein [Acutalibacteraceae bacterium]